MHMRLPQRAQVQENHHLHLRLEFRDKVLIHLRDVYIRTRLVEKDTHAFYCCQLASSMAPGEMETFLCGCVWDSGGRGKVIGGVSHEFGELGLVFSFGGPLFFFAVAPEAEEGGEEDGEEEGEPRTVRDFCEGGGEVQTVQGDER
jgi:hypothetical protein